MYRNSYQRGLFTVLSSGGSRPFGIWECITKNGYIKRFLDAQIKTMVIEIRGSNVSTTYMQCPKGNDVLGITMPFMVMVCKNLHKYFSFEITILDDTGVRRRFRISNFQSTTQILPLCTVMPIALSPGWNQVQFNLAEFTYRAYKKQYVEVQKIKINANIRLKRIYFAQKLLSEDELPADFKLFYPPPEVKNKKMANKESINTLMKSASATLKTDQKVKKDSSKENIADNLQEQKSLSRIPAESKLIGEEEKSKEQGESLLGEAAPTPDNGEDKDTDEKSKEEGQRGTVIVYSDSNLERNNEEQENTESARTPNDGEVEPTESVKPDTDGEGEPTESVKTPNDEDPERTESAKTQTEGNQGGDDTQENVEDNAAVQEN